MKQTMNTTNTKTSSLQNLLKEATALKKEKKYSEACDKLREAFSVVGENNLAIIDRLRLPMYLQLAGRADEGWGELNRLIITHLDRYSQISIAAHMAKFLRNEGKYKTAVMFSVWELCMRKDVDMEAHASISDSADQKPKRAEEWKALGLPPLPEISPATGVTPLGNPIYDVSYPSLCNRLSNNYSREAICEMLEHDLAKLVTKEIISAVATDLTCLLDKPPPYDISSVRDALAKHLV